MHAHDRPEETRLAQLEVVARIISCTITGIWDQKCNSMWKVIRVSSVILLFLTCHTSMARPSPTPCRVCSRLCVSNKFSHFRQNPPSSCHRPKSATDSHSLVTGIVVSSARRQHDKSLSYLPLVLGLFASSALLSVCLCAVLTLHCYPPGRLLQNSLITKQSLALSTRLRRVLWHPHVTHNHSYLES